MGIVRSLMLTPSLSLSSKFSSFCVNSSWMSAAIFSSTAPFPFSSSLVFSLLLALFLSLPPAFFLLTVAAVSVSVSRAMAGH